MAVACGITSSFPPFFWQVWWWWHMAGNIQHIPTFLSGPSMVPASRYYVAYGLVFLVASIHLSLSLLATGWLVYTRNYI